MKQERLNTLIQKLAEIRRASLHPARGYSIQPIINRQKILLSHLYMGVSLASQNKPFIPVATEWLLDNYYLIQQTHKQIKSDMPAKYYRRLPKLTESPLKGYPSILALAQEFINTCDCHFDLDQLSHHILFTTQLTLGELWAIPTMLRIVVMETIVQTLYKDATLPIAFNKQFTIQKSLNINETIAHCFTTLRNLNTWNWKDFVESISQVEAILRNDPAQVYATMDFSTRDRYRKVIEHLAVNAHIDEVIVAQTAINTAKKVSQNYLHDQNPENQIDKIHFDLLSHIGYYLVDKGRPTLEKEIGYRHPWIISFKELIYRFSTLYYLGLITIFTITFLSGLFLLVQPSIQNIRILFLMGFVGIIPASITAVQVVNWITTHLIPPRVLSKLDFENGVPPGFSTMVVVPTLLSSDSYIDELLQKLEINYIGNDDPNIFFALLTDFIDAPEENMPEDDILLTKAQNLIADLNNKYQRSTGQIFYLLHRRRLWNPSENCWMGWERKRGKLMEFNQLILGNPNTTYILSQNQIKTLPKPRFIITLDSDTYMPHKTSNQLIATLAHPLNQVLIDKKSNQVLRGYILLQPHINVTPTSANQSIFSRIYQGEYGLDLYTPAISDLYQDLFGSGIFAGKGIYDLNGLDLCLKDRCPENSLLSHDLFEGAFARVALVSDIVLFEEYPSTYLAQIKRSIRWVRGDWQILPWLSNRVPDATAKKVPNQLSLINRWKILDNLIRSLFYPSLLILLLFGWFVVPASALAVTLISLCVVMIPFVLGITSRLLRGVMAAMSGPIQTALWFNATESLGYSIRNSVFQWFLNLAFLPHQAVMLINAIVITLVRVFLTHRRLLQWTTAAHINSLNHQNSSLQVWKIMTWCPIISLIIAGSIMWLTPSSILVAAPLLILWFISPQLAYWISLPPTDKQRSINEEQELIFRQLARRTWQYYEHFAGPEDNWLAPDHYQEEPRGAVVHSTSPTNIGMHLLSILGANDMGYIGIFDMTLLLFMTFDTLNKLERYRGHILNWYDTRTLTPLQPRYISVVDSGNFAACLLALKQGCFGLLERPLLNWQNWQGFLDTVDVLADVLSHLENNPESQVGKPLLNLLHSYKEQIIAIKQKPELWISTADQLKTYQMDEFKKCMTELANSNLEGVDAAILRDLRVWTELVRKAADNLFTDVIGYMPWLPVLTQIPTLNSTTQLHEIIANDCQKLYELLKPNTTTKICEISNLCKECLSIIRQIEDQLKDLVCTPEEIEPIHIWCNSLRESLQQAITSTEALQISLISLSNQAESIFNEMDFTFMFDEDRKVFNIGYNVTTGKLDENHYDLAASESRIASLIAIAKGDVPASHWQHLGRPQTTVGNYRTVLSWSGTMFEYLMPNLLAQNPERTLLGQSCRAIVERQIEYGTQKGIPWGISESGFYGFDAQQNYQYRAFGVPGLGFKRDLDEDLVITPYASLLAISINPIAVYRNILELIRLKMMGECGFYESVDYTISRMPLGQQYAIVKSYMAHHQGMIFLSLVNFLNEDGMIKRFHKEPRIQSVELLLYEKVPYRVPLSDLPPQTARLTRPIDPHSVDDSWEAPVLSPSPLATILSNGNLSSMITSAGSGYISWNGIDLTRWRADFTQEDWGIWLFIQDADSCDIWSVGHQPTGGRSLVDEGIRFYPDKVTFHRHDHDTLIGMSIVVAPEDDAEIRLVSITNDSEKTRRLRLTSYAEVVLSPHDADIRHPAFNKLFIESEYLSELNGLIFTRNPRSSKEKPLYLLHQLIVEPGFPVSGRYETSRERFIGRCRSQNFPGALKDTQTWLTETTGSTLDPVMAIGQEVVLEPHTNNKMVFLTAASESRQELLKIALRYRSWRNIHEAFDKSRINNIREINELEIASGELERYQRIFSMLIYPGSGFRASPAILAANTKGQSGLWVYAVSGDYPILLVEVDDLTEISVVNDVLKAHTFWRRRQIKIDLIILNMLDTGYNQDTQNLLYRLIAQNGGETWINRRGGIFLIHNELISEEDRTLMRTCARVVLSNCNGSLEKQLVNIQQSALLLPRLIPTAPPLEFEYSDISNLVKPTNLLFDNGYGGFSPDGKEYMIFLDPEKPTPAAWINVIANPTFGCLVSDHGSGYTWAENSSENRLTPWNNDPLSDQPGEVLYLRDEENGQFWSPLPAPIHSNSPFIVHHCAGQTYFEHYSHQLVQETRIFISPDDPVKIIKLSLENKSKKNRRITATIYVEWVLGSSREMMQSFLIPEFSPKHNALLVRNPYNSDFSERVAFVAASKEVHGLTTDRTEFIGRHQTLANPAALKRVGLTGNVSPRGDPCSVIQVHLWLAPGEKKEINFLLGEGSDRTHATQIIEKYLPDDKVDAALDASTQFWDDVLGTIRVNTPDNAMNIILNRWLLYQSLSCRVWGRSALYQSGGAYGFRDQLQDVMALAMHGRLAILARQQILESARHQFPEGDVLHWWHPPSGKGIRSRCSDDLLWLPYVTSYYVNATGDTAILDEIIPFLSGDILGTEEEERYGQFANSDESGTLLDHCKRAIQKASTSGVHGIPLMNGGDWNDGMNRVGINGKGESIWLGWFLYATLDAFGQILEMREGNSLSQSYRQQAALLREALENNAWDGEWYIRAFYDDGTPLGSSTSEECKIDSIAQSWGVISGAAAPERARKAMQSVVDKLVKPDIQIVQLFDPPFDKTTHDPGYIKGYLPGIRENGGQYTHAAEWVALAFAQLGDGDMAEWIFRLLNPIYHSETPEKAATYRVEPYVVAADIYSRPPHAGRGGWTWYTGSASWMYRTGIEGILGIHRKGNSLEIDPCIPRNWPCFEISIKIEQTTYFVNVDNAAGVNHGITRFQVDGMDLTNNRIELNNEKPTRQIFVQLGNKVVPGFHVT